MVRYFYGDKNGIVTDDHGVASKSKRFGLFPYWESWHMYGYRGKDTLIGGDKGDYIDGGQGGDLMIGGLGRDTYIVDYWGDRIIEEFDEGYDTVYSSVNYTLPDNVEALRLENGNAPNGVGNNGDNLIVGNAENNVLYGLGGKDTIIGGTGGDQMIGGLDDDVYFVDYWGDRIIEEFNEGYDTIYSSWNYTLPDNVEALLLQEHGNAVNGAGNSADNKIVGNTKNNVLSGLDGDDHITGGAGVDNIDGGRGADIMIGGTENDKYVVDNFGDQVIEHNSEGYDTVHSYLSSYVMPDHVEKLELHGNAAAGIGNATRDYIIGNEHNNLLAGEGGNDDLIGNAGRDTLIGGGRTNDTDRLWGDGPSGNGGYADTFVIGDLNGVYYQGAGEAQIMDFSSQDGDKVQLGATGNRNLVSLVQNQNVGNGSALDTQVLYNGNRVATIFDTTNVSIASDFLFG